MKKLQLAIAVAGLAIATANTHAYSIKSTDICGIMNSHSMCSEYNGSVQTRSNKRKNKGSFFNFQSQNQSQSQATNYINSVVTTITSGTGTGTAIAFTSGTQTQDQWQGQFQGQWQWQGDNQPHTEVPEPGTVALFSLGLLGLWASRRRIAA